MIYRDKDGNLHNFDVIQGLSAYESAKIGGYDKTEEEFYKELSDLATNESVEEVKAEIGKEVSQLSEEIAELLPTFSSADNGKILGIVNGKLAWVIAEISGGNDTPTPPIPQIGTWQYKATPNKKYVIIGTDDDNIGNPKFLRLLRTYNLPYTMNVESEDINKLLGTDIDESIFTSSDAPSIFPQNTSVLELGKYIHDNNLGEVAQHGDAFLWDSSKLTDAIWNDLYTTYQNGGGSKALDDFKVELLEVFKENDVFQGASYVRNSRQILEQNFGFKINTVGIWGGKLVREIDGIEIEIPKYCGGFYNFKNDGYTAAATDLNMHAINNHNPFEISREMTDFDTIIDHITNVMKIGDIQEFYWHMPFSDVKDISMWRNLMGQLKALVDNGEIEVITREQYAKLGEYVENPVISLTVTRSSTSIAIGESDDKSNYTVIANYLDGTTKNVSDTAIVEYVKDTSVSKTVDVYAFYKGISNSVLVDIGNSVIEPIEFKDMKLADEFNGVVQKKYGGKLYAYSVKPGATVYFNDTANINHSCAFYNSTEIEIGMTLNEPFSLKYERVNKAIEVPDGNTYLFIYANGDRTWTISNTPIE